MEKNNMKKITIDIETLPAREDQRETLQKIYDKQVAKKLKAVTQDNGFNIPFEEFFRKTSLDGSFGRILCIGYAINDEESSYICHGEDEKQTLEDFWTLYSKDDLLIGHNILNFDFKFIVQRSMILKIKPTVDLAYHFVRYKHFPIFDTMQEWIGWFGTNLGLEHVALAMGIPSPKGDIDGSKVYDYYLAGKTQEICDYCKRDVETTRKIYKRISFSE